MYKGFKWILSGMFVFLLCTVMGYTLYYSGVFVEHKVMEQSYQRSERRAERTAILDANLKEIEAMLVIEQDPIVRANLEAQRTAINVQLNAAKR